MKEDPTDPTNDQAGFRGGVSSESLRPIRFAGSVLGAQRHVCAFFHNADEQYPILLPFIRDPVICVYDLAKLSGAVVVDVLRTHPMVVIGGLLQENPFFVPPDEFLRQLWERGAAQAS